MNSTCHAAGNETWWLELIEVRGRRLGFGNADLDDAVQEVALQVIQFRYEETRSNGATQRTALISVIDNCLLAVRRRESRYAKHVERLPESQHAAEPDYRDQTPLVLDMQSAMETLSDQDREICELLSYGCSILEVANHLGCDWHVVKQRINHIRDRFAQMGLDAWLGSV